MPDSTPGEDRELNRMIVVNPADNVGTVVSDVSAGDVLITDEDGSEIIVLDDIPFGHKLALCPIEKGNQIIKYGEVIGSATQPIRAGQHVHIHNVDSQRGRMPGMEKSDE